MPFSPLTVIMILVLGVLIFGKNLPDVVRQIGSALLEFRKGVGEWKEIHHRPVNVGKKQGVVTEDESAEHFESLGAKFVSPPVEE